MSLFGGEPRRPETPSPPIITSPTTATPGLSNRGVKLAVIDSVDNANFPQFATVLVDNKTPGEMGYSLPAGVGPFAAGGTANFQYYYNNGSGVGGSYCYVDCDARLVISFTGNVSDTPPTPFYKALADHLHNGNLDPDSFQNPQPINLSNGEISSILPYGNNSTQVQQVVGTDGALLATTFPGQVKQITSGSFAGYFQLITNTVKDVNPLTCAQTSTANTCPWICVTWQFMTTFSQAGGNFNPGGDSTSAYGPIIWDANGNDYWLRIQNSDLGAIAQGEPDFINTTISGTDTWLNQLHTIQFMMQPLSGGNGHNIAWYVDGIMMTGNTSLFGSQNYTGPFFFGWQTNNANIYPPTSIYARVFRAELSAAHHLMSTTYTQNWDPQSAQLTNTLSVSGNTMNVTPFITDFTLHYSINSGATALTYWYDNGSGADAKIYNSYDTSGATDKNISHTTSGAPSGTQTVSAGQTWYVMAYYSLSTTSIHWTLQSTPFTGSQVRTAYADGVICCMASLTTSTSDPSGPISIVANATGSRTGNGGKTKL